MTDSSGDWLAIATILATYAAVAVGVFLFVRARIRERRQRKRLDRQRRLVAQRKAGPSASLTPSEPRVDADDPAKEAVRKARRDWEEANPDSTPWLSGFGCLGIALCFLAGLAIMGWRLVAMLFSPDEVPKGLVGFWVAIALMGVASLWPMLDEAEHPWAWRLGRWIQKAFGVVVLLVAGVAAWEYFETHGAPRFDNNILVIVVVVGGVWLFLVLRAMVGDLERLTARVEELERKASDNAGAELRGTAV